MPAERLDEIERALARARPVSYLIVFSYIRVH